MLPSPATIIAALNMRLYLSSMALGDDPSALVALTTGRRALVIANALDNAEARRRDGWVEDQIDELGRLGFDARELDLRDSFACRALTLDCDLLWATGGNVFLLRRAFAQSGLDVALTEALRADRFVYGGFSAGAMMLSPSLRGAELVDPPHDLAEGYDADVIWDALGLVDFWLAPHFKSAHPESYKIDDEIAYLERHGMKYYALRDGQALVVNGNLGPTIHPANR